CWAWSINFPPGKPLSVEERREMEEGKGLHCPYEPGTFRPLANKDNDYLMDRAAQKDKRAYSGVFGFAAQDASLQESMGPIQDHEHEKLLPTDRAIIMARRLLYEAAVALENGGEPPALDAGPPRVPAPRLLLDPPIQPRDS